MTRNDLTQPQFPIRSEPQPAVRARRGQHRERDYGIGYGNSSGYGCTRRYARGWTGAPRFRCS